MKFINSFYLKVLALLFMTIDHIGVIFQLDIIFRIIGRLSLPLFAFLIYQGYIYTRSRLKYFLRLFIFGFFLELILFIISNFMFIPKTPKNIFLTLSFGLLSLIIIDFKINIIFRTLLISMLVYISIILSFDYSWFGILLILSFRFYPKYYYISFLSHLTLCVIFSYFYHVNLQYFSLFSWFFILYYNNKKGFGFKYFFYIYYPLHLVVLYLIAFFIIFK